jgi:alpha-L-fucosidase
VGIVKRNRTGLYLTADRFPAWFEDSKFGIFIHWGLFSVPAWAPTNVSLYEKYAEWYWKRLLDPKAETYKHFNEFHEKMYGAGFKYQDFVKDFTCELLTLTNGYTISAVGCPLRCADQ